MNQPLSQQNKRVGCGSLDYVISVRRADMQLSRPRKENQHEANGSGGAQLAEMHKPTVNVYTPRGASRVLGKPRGSYRRVHVNVYAFTGKSPLRETLNLSDNRWVLVPEARSPSALVFSGPPPSPGYRLAARYWI